MNTTTELERLCEEAKRFQTDKREDIRKFAAACEGFLRGLSAFFGVQEYTFKPLTKHNRFTPSIDVTCGYDHCLVFANQHAVPGVIAVIEVQGSVEDAEYWWVLNRMHLPSGSHQRLEFRGVYRHLRAVVVGWIAPWSASISSFEIDIGYTGSCGGGI